MGEIYANHWIRFSCLAEKCFHHQGLPEDFHGGFCVWIVGGFETEFFDAQFFEEGIKNTYEIPQSKADVRDYTLDLGKRQLQVTQESRKVQNIGNNAEQQFKWSHRQLEMIKVDQKTNICK